MRRGIVFIIVLIFIFPTIIKNNEINRLEDVSIKQLSDDLILPNDNDDIYWCAGVTSALYRSVQNGGDRLGSGRLHLVGGGTTVLHGHVASQVDEAVRVAPLVIVPADQLDE